MEITTSPSATPQRRDEYDHARPLGSLPLSDAIPHVPAPAFATMPPSGDQGEIYCDGCGSFKGTLLPEEGKLLLPGGDCLRFPFTIQCGQSKADGSPCGRNVKWRKSSSQERS